MRTYPFDPVAFGQVCADMTDERIRQIQLREARKFPLTAADGANSYHKLAMLVEEVGEVSRELQHTMMNVDRLYEELIQVATIAAAWCEGIRRDARPDQTASSD